MKLSELREAGIPRILYHGNNRKYIGCHQYYKYRGKLCSEKVYATDSLMSACGYASQRAEEFNSEPVILIIDTLKLPEIKRERASNVYLIPRIPKNTYFLFFPQFETIRNSDKIENILVGPTKDECREINRLEEFLKKISKQLVPHCGYSYRYYYKC